MNALFVEDLADKSRRDLRIRSQRLDTRKPAQRYLGSSAVFVRAATWQDLYWRANSNPGRPLAVRAF
jgi:hypothetical protein